MFKFAAAALTAASFVLATQASAGSFDPVVAPAEVAPVEADAGLFGTGISATTAAIAAALVVGGALIIANSDDDDDNGGSSTTTSTAE